jgi:hypothetical protein
MTDDLRTTELVERLRARFTVRDEFGTCHPLVNPDGPEAADLIEQQATALLSKDAEIAELRKERDAFREQAINRGWNWRMCDAYGREEYRRHLENEIDATHANMIAARSETEGQPQQPPRER